MVRMILGIGMILNDPFILSWQDYDDRMNQSHIFVFSGELLYSSVYLTLPMSLSELLCSPCIPLLIRCVMSEVTPGSLKPDLTRSQAAGAAGSGSVLVLKGLK